MEKKTVYPRLSACNLLLMATALCWIFIQSGCNNSDAQSVKQADQKTSTNWDCVEITFKAKTTNEEWREKSIKEIEKMLIKKVTPYTKEYKDFCPGITITKMPFFDSLKYQICVVNTYCGSGKPEARIMSSTTPCPPCPGLCPRCDTNANRVMSLYRLEKFEFDKSKY